MIPAVPMLGFTLSQNPTMGEALIYLLSGIGVVMVTLLILSIVCVVTGFLIRTIEKPKSAQATGAIAPQPTAQQSAASTVAPATGGDGTIPRHHLVALFATVSMLEGRGGVIRRISFANKRNSDELVR